MLELNTPRPLGAARDRSVVGTGRSGGPERMVSGLPSGPERTGQAAAARVSSGACSSRGGIS